MCCVARVTVDYATVRLSHYIILRNSRARTWIADRSVHLSVRCTCSVALLPALARRSEMKEAELEAQRTLRLRDERIKAYSTLARLTKAIWLDAPGDLLPIVYEALSEVEILADDPKLKETAEKLVDTWATAWESASEARLGGAGQLSSPFDAPGYRNVEYLLRNLRNAFTPSSPRTRSG